LPGEGISTKSTSRSMEDRPGSHRRPVHPTPIRCADAAATTDHQPEPGERPTRWPSCSRVPRISSSLGDGWASPANVSRSQAFVGIARSSLALEPNQRKGNCQHFAASQAPRRSNHLSFRISTSQVGGDGEPHGFFHG
jgi:hypothetical protein